LFVKNVISALIPDELWGGMHNKTVVMEPIEQFIGSLMGINCSSMKLWKKLRPIYGLKVYWNVILHKKGNCIQNLSGGY